MFAEILQFQILKGGAAPAGVHGANISSSVSGTNNGSATTLGDMESADPNYANTGGLLDGWNQNPYALDCEDYDPSTCH